MSSRSVSKSPPRTRVFVSFDYEHDDDLRVMLLGQAKHRKTPFLFEDWSIKYPTKGWKRMPASVARALSLSLSSVAATRTLPSG